MDKKKMMIAAVGGLAVAFGPMLVDWVIPKLPYVGTTTPSTQKWIRTGLLFGAGFGGIYLALKKM
jgi:hypothetical protein